MVEVWAAAVAAIAALTAASLTAVASVYVVKLGAQLQKQRETTAQVAQAQNAALDREHSARLASLTGEHGLRMELLKAQISSQVEEVAVQRIRNEEARKRSLQEFEPLLFRLAEASEQAFERIEELSVLASANLIQPVGDRGWLRSSGYMLATTVYVLLAPLAVARLIQERVTRTDVAVDPVFAQQYQLAKRLFVVLTADQVLSQSYRRLAYRPFAPDARKRELENPAEFRSQGVPRMWLDMAVEALIDRSLDRPDRVKSYSKFQEVYCYWKEAPEPGQPMNPKHHPTWRDQGRDDPSAFGRVTDIVLGFHPRTRPVTWRILIAQALIHRALIDMARPSAQASLPQVPWLTDDTDWEQTSPERTRFDWRYLEPREDEKPDRPFDEDVSSEKAIFEPLAAAKAYLRELDSRGSRP